MELISTRTHGVLDYVLSAVFIVAPFLFGFANRGAAQWVLIAIGVAMIGVSLVTDYELSVTELVPMPMHLSADIGTGVLMLVSPWLLGFAGQVFWPHVVFGLIEIGTAMMTRRHPRWAPALTGSRRPSHSPSRTPGTQRSEVEGNPGASAATCEHRIFFPSQKQSRLAPSYCAASRAPFRFALRPRKKAGGRIADQRGGREPSQAS